LPKLAEVAFVEAAAGLVAADSVEVAVLDLAVVLALRLPVTPPNQVSLQMERRVTVAALRISERMSASRRKFRRRQVRQTISRTNYIGFM